MTDDYVRLQPCRFAEDVSLFHADPVRPTWMFPPQHFCQFRIERGLCGPGHSSLSLVVSRDAVARWPHFIVQPGRFA